MLDAVEGLVDRAVRRRRAWAYGYSGQSFQERASGGQGGLVFGLGLIIVFLVLAAQYESWSIPFAVLLGVPFGVFGALLGVWLRGMPSDIYFQVGAHHGGRPRRQERDPDRGVRQRASQPGPAYPGGGAARRRGSGSGRSS